MRLTIKYFGLLAEVTQCSEEQIEFSGKIINDFLEIIWIFGRIDGFSDCGHRFKCGRQDSPGFCPA